jgi:exonuclease III
MLVQFSTFNINGLYGKDKPLMRFLTQHKIDVLLLQETHLLPFQHSPLKNTFVDLRKKIEYLQQRGGKHRRGGVLVKISDRLRNKAELIKEDLNHSNWAIFQIGNLLIATGYFSPTTNDDLFFEFLGQIERLLDSNPNLGVVVAGDFNARLGEATGDTLVNSRGRKLLAFLVESPLTVSKLESGTGTSFGYGSSRSISIPDILLSHHCTPLEVNALDREASGGSDHCPLLWKIDISTPPPSKNFSRFDIRKLDNPEILKNYERILLETSPLSKFQHVQDINLLWDIFTSWINYAAGKSIGYFRFVESNNVSFWTDELLSFNLNFNSITHAYRRNPSATDSAIVHKAKQDFQQALQKRRQHLFETMTNNLSKTKNTNGLLRMIKGTRRRVEGHQCALKLSEMANHMAHFGNTFGLKSSATCDFRLPPPTHELGNFNKDMVSKVVGTMKRGKAPGPDRIPADLYLNSQEVHQVLAAIFNICYARKVVPNQWNEALIVPVFKKGDKLKAKSYRPIALSCTARRIYEKLIAQSLDHNLLSPFQGGFRPKRNVFHQIWTLDLMLKKNKKLHTCLMDLEAAYDTVNRDILYMKLYTIYNVDVNTIYRLKSLFDNVHSRLVLKGDISAPIKNERGLLQGSSLSPILFNFFINESPQGFY